MAVARGDAVYNSSSRPRSRVEPTLSPCKIISRRLNSYFVEVAGDEQSSKLGSGRADGTFVVKATASLLREHGQESYIIFVDLEKAYIPSIESYFGSYLQGMASLMDSSWSSRNCMLTSRFISRWTELARAACNNSRRGITAAAAATQSSS